MLPGLLGEYLRRAFLRQTVTQCGNDCCISYGVSFVSPDVRIGSGVYIGSRSIIGHADIGNDVLIGSGVMVLSGKRQHRFDRLDIPIRHQGGEFNRVRIEDDCWLGNGAIVMANVGTGSVIGAGSVLGRDVEPYSIVAGNPAEVRGSRRPQPKN